MKSPAAAAPSAATILTIRGVGYSASAINEDMTVTVLAETLQKPKAVAANIVGISCTLAINAILNDALMPNLAHVMNTGMRLRSCQKIIKSVEPRAESKYIDAKPIFGPTRK